MIMYRVLQKFWRSIFIAFVLVLCGLGQTTAAPLTPSDSNDGVVKPAPQKQLLSGKRSIELSDAEKAWLKKHPVIRVANTIELPPVIFRGEASGPSGIAIEHLKRIGDELGVRFEFVSAPNWSRGLEKFKAHGIDILPVMARSKEREAFANFTTPYLSIPYVIFTREDVPYIGGIDKLSGRKVAVTNNSITHQILRLKHPDIHALPVRSNPEAIDKLARGEAYAYISTLLTTGRYLRQGYTNIKASGHTPYKLELAMGVRKDWVLFTGMMQKVLDTISKEERDFIQSKWVGAQIEQEVIPSYIWWALCGVAGLLVLSVIIIVMFRRQLVLKTALLHDRVKELSGLYSISTIFERQNVSIAEALQAVAGALPPAWHYPDITCARVTFGGDVFTSTPFQESPLRQACDIVIDGSTAGSVEVFCTAAMPELNEGPFLKEERNLIDEIARQIGVQIERLRSRNQLQEAVEKRTAEIKSAHILLQKTFDSLNEAVLIVDAKDRTIIDCNDAAEDIFGYSRDQIIGNNTKFLHVSEDAYQRFGEMVFSALEEGGVFSTEFMARHSDGSKIFTEHAVTGIRNQSGELTQVVSAIRDISQRKQAEKDLLDANLRMALATKAAEIGIWDLNLVNNELIWDDRMFRLYGVKPEDFSDAYEAWQKGVHPDDLECAVAVDDNVISGRIEFNTTFRIIWPNGDVRHIKANALVIRDDQGHPLRMIGTSYDITDEERTKSSLEKALEVEKEFSALQQQFVSLVSHEFRTPLTIIDSSAQLLLRHKQKMTPEELEVRGGKIRNGVQRMISLMDKVLYSANLNEGQIPLTPEACDLRALIVNTCQHQAELSPNYDIRMDVDDLPPVVTADRKLLSQVFQNLLSNAVKYAPDSQLIEVTGWTEEDSAMVSVADHGIGIRTDEQSKLFQRFFRASNSKGIPGTGLGLNVCKQFLEMHGGHIAVESAEGEGATFTVKLPIDGGRSS